MNQEKLEMRLWQAFISFLIVATGIIRISQNGLILTPQAGSPLSPDLTQALRSNDVN